MLPRPQIPGTQRIKRLEENAGGFAIELSPEELAVLDTASSDATFGDRCACDSSRYSASKLMMIRPRTTWRRSAWRRQTPPLATGAPADTEKLIALLSSCPRTTDGA